MPLILDTREEVFFKRQAHFLEAGLSTMRFLMPPNAASGSLMVSDAAGVGTWTATTAITLAVLDSLFTILDDADNSKILQFQLDGLTSGTHTFRPPPSAAGSTLTLAAIDLAQTFSKAQTFNPDSDVVAVTVKASVGQTLDLIQCQTSGGANFFRVHVDGRVTINTQTTATSQGLAVILAGDNADGLVIQSQSATFADNYLLIQNSASRIVLQLTTAGILLLGNTTDSPANVRLRVQGAVGQSANLSEWKDGGGNILAAFDAAGLLLVNTTDTTGRANIQPAAGGVAIASAYTESAQTANTNGIWRLAPTLGSSGTVGNQTMLNIDPTITQLGGFQTVRMARFYGTVTPSANSATVICLDFNPTVSGTNNVTSAIGINGQVTFGSTGTLTTGQGIKGTFTGSAGHGTITTAEACDLSIMVNGNVTNMRGIDIAGFVINSGTTTTLRHINFNDATGAGTVTTQTGIFIPNLTKATTNYSLDIGSAQSRHVGRFSIGGTTNPTAILHLQGAGTGQAAMRIESSAAPTSPNSGDLWHDSTMKRGIAYWNGVKESISGVLYTQTAQTTAWPTSAETSLLQSGVGTLTLPANFLVVGKTLRLHARGSFDSGAVPDSFNIRFKLGSTTIVATGSLTPAANVSDGAWECDVILTCFTVGATGTVIAHGEFRHDDDTAGAIHYNWKMILAGSGTVTIDTTASLAVDLTADYTTGTSDAIRGKLSILEALN